MSKKQIHKSKEQIVWEKEQQNLALKRKEFIDGRFMPFMEEITTDLNDAQMVAQACSASINQAFQNLVREMKVSDLKLEDKLNKNKPELTDRYRRIFNLLANETIDDSLKILNGLFNEINRVIMAEFGKKTLKEINKKNETETKTN